MAEKGYAVEFGESLRAGRRFIASRKRSPCRKRGCSCLRYPLPAMCCGQVFAAFTTGGGYEALGWGYGPSVGDGWKKSSPIISRASGAPVIAGALEYTAQAIRGKLPEQVAKELAAAQAAGFEDELKCLSPKPEAGADDVPPMPKAEPCDEEIHGIDVLDWTRRCIPCGRQTSMPKAQWSCTGPVVKLASANLAKPKICSSRAAFIAYILKMPGLPQERSSPPRGPRF